MRLSLQLILALIIILIGGYRSYLSVRKPLTEKVQQATCLKNISQIGKAMQMYACDFDGSLPVGRTGSDTTWLNAISIFATSSEYPDYADKALRCPRHPVAKEVGTYYGFNYSLSGLSFSQIADPSVNVLCADSRGIRTDRWWINDRRFVNLEHNRLPYACHKLKANTVFADGHIECTDPLELSRSNWLP